MPLEGHHFSGSVFNMLHPLPLEGQTIVVDAAMNYRKRGLVYFSGFDFTFTGRYDVLNPQERDIYIVFVFPISVQKNRVLLSDLVFNVNGEPTGIDLADESDKLVWTGRVKAGDESAQLEMLLEREQGGFLLSGDLDFQYPSASWPINGFYAELSLPAVFNYQWAGGSLAPTEKLETTEYAYKIPTPGKKLSFHQPLVASAPDLQVRYTVDLEGKYFQGDVSSVYYR